MTRKLMFAIALLLTPAVFALGAQMDSASYSVNGALYQPNVVSYLTGQVPLAPGAVTSCGKILAPGTYVLGADLAGISGPCFIIATSSVTIDGAGHTVTAAAANANYAVTATSTEVGGSAFTDIAIDDIVFSGFSGGGIDARGNTGTSVGGAGGEISVSSSTVGSIVATGGSAPIGIGGAGGSITITGTDLALASSTLSVTGGTGSIGGLNGTISVTGSVLVANGQLWNGNDSTWLGERVWNFVGNSYNAGTVSGTTTFFAYTATSSVVTVSGDSNFRGTGIVNGTVLDSLGEPVTTWNLVNGSMLRGVLDGDAIFNDTSWNRSTVMGDAIFTAASYNSISGILNGDPTGASNGHTITGSVTFSATTSPVIFSVNAGSTWSANTSAWNFATSGPTWAFNFSNNTGSIYGNVTFANSSQNRGVVVGNGSFTTSSYNAGTTTSADFRNSTYNIGTTTTANFYDSSANSHLTTPGYVSVQCDFFDASLPGIGSCPLNGTFYHIPYYFTDSVSSNWDDAGNWWFDTAFTEPSGLPHNSDNVFIAAGLVNGPSVPVSLGNIYVGSSTTGGGSFSVNLTNASGPAYFYDQTTNAGVVNGVFHVFGNRSLTTANGSGSFTGAVAFHDNSWNDMSLPGNAAFYDTSYNDTGATVGGDAEFFGSNANNGTVVGVATVYAGATLSGSGDIQGNTLNLGSISNGFFDGVITNITGAITGAVSNLVTAIFNGGGYVSSSGSLSGDAEFNATSSNRGIVSGTSTFSGYSYNIGTTSNATFIGDFAENVYNGAVGFVSGVKARLYTAIAPQFALFRDFTDSAWTIIADNTVVKLLYANLVNLFGEDPSAVTTLVERNGGFILRPLAPGVINSCGVLDVASSTYTLGSDIAGYPYDTCFIVRADGITIDGGEHTVTGISTSTSLYGVLSTSTLSIDPSPDAFQNITVKNISFVNFAYGVYGRGNDVPLGTGGHGTNLFVEHSNIGNIDVNGGDPIEQAGDGGDVSIITSVAGVISSLGGHSTACGIAGNGGNVDVTTDSVYEQIINDGGLSTGCAPEASPTHGSSGRRNTTIVSASTQASLAAAQAANSHTVSTSLERKIQQQAEGLRNIFSFLPSVIRLFPISLDPLPVFGTDGSAFSFVSSINSFLFAPLPAEMDSRMASILRSLGIRYERDFIALKNKPLAIGGTGGISGLFSVSVSGAPVMSYITYTSTSSVAQVVRVKAKAQMSIGTGLVSDVTGYFDGKRVVFVKGTLKANAPSVAGRYVLSASSSPIPLIIEVTDSQVDVPVAQTTKIGIFRRIFNWVVGLFK